MDPEEVTKFFQQIMEQLGPTAQRTFQVVGQRVAAEAFVWMIVGFAFLIIALVWTVGVLRWYPKTKNYDKEVWLAANICIIGGFAISAAFLIVTNVVILNSLEYSTIERILNLVGGAKR